MVIHVNLCREKEKGWGQRRSVCVCVCLCDLNCYGGEGRGGEEKGIKIYSVVWVCASCKKKKKIEYNYNKNVLKNQN